VTQPLRVAFVGQSVFFRQCALEERADGIEPCFVDFRAGAPPEPLIAELRERDPDVVLVFRPEIIPEGLFDGMRALTIGYLTEPLPRGGGDVHDDLRARMWWLERVDASNFDRIVSFDPLIAETASAVLPVWRSLPIPVADSLYGEVRPMATPPRMLFVGRPTPHREEMLEPIKREHPIVHIGHGLYGADLQRFFARTDVQLNLHNNPYPTFENRMLLALAAGHLVISESLSPDHGLKDREHYVQAETAAGLSEVVGELIANPAPYAAIRQSGRAAAERFRASAVYPQLIRDAVGDVAERGGRDA
jgi:hypothetical protein